MSMELHQIIKYFGNDCNDSEKIEIEDWKNASIENLKLFNKLKKIWDTSDKVPEIINPDFENAWKKIQLGTGIKGYKQKQISLRIDFMLVLKIAAVVIVIIGLGFFINKVYFNKPTIQMAETLSTVKKEICLSDGTTVYLNHYSKIYFPEKFKSKTREINLEGEAFFKVAKDSRHPFIVHASGTLIKVLGTSFNIKTKDSSRVTVSVLTGKVVFGFEKNKTKLIQLGKGDRGTFDIKTQQIIKSKYKNENFLAWKTGILQFNNQLLREAAKVLSDYYSINIEVDPALQNRIITVSFDNLPLEEVLKILELTMDIKIDKSADKIILKTSGINQR